MHRLCEKKSLIEEEYVVLANQSTSDNLTFNAILEYIHAVISNQIHTYNIKDTEIKKDDPWLFILAMAEFEKKSK